MIVKTKVSVASKQMTLTPEQRSPGRCQSPCVVWWGMRLLKSFKVSGVLCFLVLLCHIVAKGLKWWCSDHEQKPLEIQAETNLLRY